MKSKFLWAYNDAELRDDPAMTRERASQMIRSWRNLPGYTVTRIAPHLYKCRIHSSSLTSLLGVVQS